MQSSVLRRFEEAEPQPTSLEIKTKKIDVADVSAALQLSVEESKLFMLLLQQHTVTIQTVADKLGKNGNNTRVLKKRLQEKLLRQNIRIGNLYGGIYFLYAEDKIRARENINKFRAATPIDL